jgi:hypothetical protein
MKCPQYCLPMLQSAATCKVYDLEVHTVLLAGTQRPKSLDIARRTLTEQLPGHDLAAAPHIAPLGNAFQGIRSLRSLSCYVRRLPFAAADCVLDQPPGHQRRWRSAEAACSQHWHQMSCSVWKPQQRCHLRRHGRCMSPRRYRLALRGAQQLELHGTQHSKLEQQTG